MNVKKKSSNWHNYKCFCSDGTSNSCFHCFDFCASYRERLKGDEIDCVLSSLEVP